MTIKYTHKDYMNSKCTYQEYYDQFVSDGIFNRLFCSFGLSMIKNGYLKDPNFNTIPLEYWDILNVTEYTKRLLEEAGDTLTLATKVCIFKVAARRIATNNIKRRRTTKKSRRIDEGYITH